MKPIAELSHSGIKAVFTDLDDTVTTEGQLLSSTLNALNQLKTKGYYLAFISGRPAGWADCLMRLLPIDAMVFENGAGIAVREDRKIKTLTLCKDQNKIEQKNKLEKIFQELKRDFPTIKLATDQYFRYFDYAIDFNEEPPFLNEKEVEMILERLSSIKSITAKLSSIHINYWCGNHTKVDACRYLLNLTNLKTSEVLYAGDSPNDEPLFQHFENSVGVANLRHFIPKMKHLPKFITEKNGGLGFEELVSKLILS